jgi:hypothetical protein
MSSLGVSRLRIVKYFDDLKTTVDECVETFIAANHLDKKLETEINQVRAGWLSEIDESEKFNLTELQKREDKHSKLEDEVLFKKFMFAFELPEGEELIDLRIVAIDEYASRGKVECLQILLKLAANTIDKSVFEEKIRKLFLSNEITVNIYSGVIYVVSRRQLTGIFFKQKLILLWFHVIIFFSTKWKRDVENTILFFSHNLELTFLS